LQSGGHLQACGTGMKKVLSSALLAAFTLLAPAQVTKLVDLGTHFWRYQANGIDQGTAWRGTNYDDSAWPAGTGLFGVESNPSISALIQTGLPINGPGGAIVTYYFRTHFQYDGTVSNPYLMISNLVDDGAVFYLNGQEFGRVLMPGGPIVYSELAMVASEEGTFTILEKRATNLIVGTNVLAVEVHQQALNSSDVVFGAAVFVEPETATTNAGTMDYSFAPIVNGYVRTSVLLTNSEFLIGGGFPLFHSNRAAGGIAKIDRSGNPVPGFYGSTNFPSSPVGSFDIYSIVATNGQIYVGGSFNGSQRVNIARLNWDGSLDTTFVPATPSSRVRALLPQADGTVIMAGEFASVGGMPRGCIARLLPNGALDTTYATGAGANNRIRAIMPLDDGRLLVGGAFTTYDGLPQNYLARLDTNGLRDATFTNAANAEVYCFTKSGSSYYVGGNFSLYNGIPAFRIARINAEGHFDASFNVGIGFSGGAIYGITEQFDGRLIIGGDFTSADGSTANAYLTRYLPNGSHDNTFNVNAPSSGFALTTTLAPDGSLLVGGNFLYQFNRHYARGLTLLRADRPPSLAIENGDGQMSITWPDVAKAFTLEEASHVTGPWTNSPLPVSVQGRRFTATNSNPSALRFYRLHAR
jgi:uncharacterized delta-60 repeat protein